MNHVLLGNFTSLCLSLVKACHARSLFYKVSLNEQKWSMHAWDKSANLLTSVTYAYQCLFFPFSFLEGLFYSNPNQGLEKNNLKFLHCPKT